HGRGVDDAGAEARLIEEQIEVLKGRRQVEPERKLDAIEVLLLLERRDHHPHDRKQRDHQEGREPGVDADLAGEAALSDAQSSRASGLKGHSGSVASSVRIATSSWPSSGSAKASHAAAIPLP